MVDWKVNDGGPVADSSLGPMETLGQRIASIRRLRNLTQHAK